MSAQGARNVPWPPLSSCLPSHSSLGVCVHCECGVIEVGDLAVGLAGMKGAPEEAVRHTAACLCIYVW